MTQPAKDVHASAAPATTSGHPNAPLPHRVPAKTTDTARWVGLGLAVAFGLLVLVPLFQSPWFDSHETVGQVPSTRYWVRLFEFIRGWSEGQIFPRWAPDTNGGFGSPLFVFCSPGLFALAAPFVLLGATHAMALKLAITLLSAAGAAGAYLLVHGETRRVDASLVAAAAWIYAPYRFVDLFVRGDLAEYAAVCLLPVVMWLYRELGRAPREHLARIATLAALAHAALIYSHTVDGQWGTELLFLMVLPTVVVSLFKGDLPRVLAFGLAFAFAIGLAAAYLLPAFADKGYAPHELNVITAGYNNPMAHLVPAALFFRFDFFAFVGDGMTGSPNRMPFSIGVPAAVALFLALGAVAWRGPTARQVLLWLCATLALLFIMTPESVPYWHLLPLGDFIQFPWRLIGLLASVSAGLIGVVWAGLIPWPLLRWVLCAAAVAWIAQDGRRFDRARGMNLDPTMSVESVRSVVDVTLDDIPPGSPPRSRPASLVDVSGPIRAVATAPRGTEYDVTIDAQGPGTVDVQAFWFPCWKIIEQRGPAELTLEKSPGALLRLSVPAAGSYTLKVAFRPTLIYWLGEMLSLLCVLLLWPVMRQVTRERHATSPPPPATAPAIV